MPLLKERSQNRLKSDKAGWNSDQSKNSALFVFSVNVGHNYSCTRLRETQSLRTVNNNEKKFLKAEQEGSVSNIDFVDDITPYDCLLNTLLWYFLRIPGSINQRCVISGPVQTRTVWSHHVRSAEFPFFSRMSEVFFLSTAVHHLYNGSQKGHIRVKDGLHCREALWFIVHRLYFRCVFVCFI